MVLGGDSEPVQAIICQLGVGIHVKAGDCMVGFCPAI